MVIARHVDKGSGRCGWFLPCNLSKSINKNLVAILYSWCIFLGGDVTLPVKQRPHPYRWRRPAHCRDLENLHLSGGGGPKRKLRKSKANVSRCELLVFRAQVLTVSFRTHECFWFLFFFPWPYLGGWYSK